MTVVLFLLLNQCTHFVNETLGCCFLNVAYKFGIFKGMSLVYWYLQKSGLGLREWILTVSFFQRKEINMSFEASRKNKKYLFGRVLAANGVEDSEKLGEKE
jgi:hypothetical protein